MSALTRIAGGLLGSRAARGAGGTRRPARRPAAGLGGTRGAAGRTAGGAGTGRGLRSLLRRAR